MCVCFKGRVKGNLEIAFFLYSGLRMQTVKEKTFRFFSTGSGMEAYHLLTMLMQSKAGLMQLTFDIQFVYQTLV